MLMSEPVNGKHWDDYEHADYDPISYDDYESYDDAGYGCAYEAACAGSADCACCSDTNGCYSCADTCTSCTGPGPHYSSSSSNTTACCETTNPSCAPIRVRCTG